MYFKNGYKLAYEFVKTNAKEIFGTKNNIPDFDADVALTFKAGEGEADLEGIKLVYFKDGFIYTSKTGIPADDDQKITVYIGEDIVIGE